MISDPVTKLQCSPTSDGSGAAIVASEAFVDKHGLAAQAVEIVGQAMTTDFESTFDGSAKNVIGYDMNVQAAQQVYDQSGLGPSDFQVIELHDCFSANELLLYEALGLCGEGEAPKLIDNNDTTYGGRWVVNPSGGLISKGHPLGADRSGAVRRAHVAAARHRRQTTGRGRHGCPATQHRPRRRGGCHRLPARRAQMRDHWPVRITWMLAAAAGVCGAMIASAGLASADDSESAQETIQKLQDQGYTVTIDKIGTAPLDQVRGHECPQSAAVHAAEAAPRRQQRRNSVPADHQPADLGVAQLLALSDYATPPLG